MVSIRVRSLAVALGFSGLVLGCSSEEPASSTSSTSASSGTSGVGGAGGAGGGAGGEALSGTPIPSDPQRPGDADAGYLALVNNGYVACGVPWTAYSAVYGPAPEALRLPGRTGKNAELPYYFSATTTASGVDIVAPNCLSCHAGELRGQIVVGLGDHAGDFTNDTTAQASAVGFLLSDPVEIAEWEKWKGRVSAIAPHIKTITVGSNPADNLAAALFAHRDRDTLAWSDTPLLPEPPTEVVPVDVPPWWHMKHKNAMFYNASGRGDHARIMMTASTLCTDTVEEATAIDAYFPDVEAYLLSIQPPAYPFPIDQAKAAQGKGIFEATCSRCHGSYGDGGVYPNLLIDLPTIGTDNALATGAGQFATDYVTWFNESFYGKIAKLDPQLGYVAPPLDGIWASAPYFHNGSVPTVAAVLESGARPAFWTRSFDSNDYTEVGLGWNYTALPAGQDAEPSASKRKLILDTTKTGYGNGGHTFGDALSADERAAVIEYLKTL